MIEMNTTLMQQYVEFLEDFCQRITTLCDGMESLTDYAGQCMDQVSGLQAAKQLLANMEVIKANLPTADDACQRLILAMKKIIEAQNAMGRGR